jgi:hypothetical protein
MAVVDNFDTGVTVNVAESSFDVVVAPSQLGFNWPY